MKDLVVSLILGSLNDLQAVLKQPDPDTSGGTALFGPALSLDSMSLLICNPLPKQGIASSVAAVALGAAIVEKHLTISRATGGPDALFSLEPHEFRELVQGIRVAEQALGRVNYEPSEGEMKSRRYRRSLFVVKNVKAGELLTGDTVRSIRPGDGLHPRHLPEVIGRPVTRNTPRGTPLSWELIG